MANYQIHEELELAVSLEEAWDFLSSPAKLKEITPDYMGFEISSEGLPDKIYPGLMISYRLSPYALWHHEHHLLKTEGGVLMSDRVTYRLPAGPLGRLAHSLFVRKQLEAIFSYREEVLVNKFGRP
jgi:ligand-binding SRPBCC domain-containing protein